GGRRAASARETGRENGGGGEGGGGGGRRVKWGDVSTTNGGASGGPSPRHWSKRKQSMTTKSACLSLLKIGIRNSGTMSIESGGRAPARSVSQAGDDPFMNAPNSRRKTG